MGKESNIVHQYFKKELPEATILVRVNPIQFKVAEIILPKNGEAELRELEVDPDILEDLKADGFEPSSPLEFNLYYSGIL
jgi:hypothetical protein